MRALLVILVALIMPTAAHAWLVHSDFNTGTVGQLADKVHPNPSTGFDTAYSAALFSGTWGMGGSGQSAAVSFTSGQTGAGTVGGVLNASTPIVAGSVVDVKADFLLPTGWTNGGTYLYLIRIPILSSGDLAVQGYISYCINSAGYIVIEDTLAAPAYQYTNTGVNIAVAINLGVNVELSVYLAKSYPVIKAWLGQTLIFARQSANYPTMVDSSNIVMSAQFATLWSGNAPATQSLFVDNAKITNEVQPCLDNYNTHFIGQTPCGTTDTTAPGAPTGLGSTTTAADIAHLLSGRPYTVTLPTGYDPAGSFPLVIYLHGGGGSRASGAADGISAAADQFGFIAAYPQGSPSYDGNAYMNSWNGGAWDYRPTYPAYSYNGGSDGPGCCGTADDVAFLSSMITRIKANYAVDNNRIYIGGISNGGLMAMRMVCESPGTFAGVFAVAPTGMANVDTAYSNLCSATATNALLVYGTSDPCNRYDGTASSGSNCTYSGGVVTCPGPAMFCNSSPYLRMHYAAMLGRFLSLNGGSLGTHSTYYNNGAADCQSYPGTKETVLCTITGGGHTWPSGAQYFSSSIIGPVSFDMSNTQIFQKVLQWQK